MTIERINLAPDLSVSRIVTGLWQIADMERDGKSIDTVAAANALQEYSKAGLTSFDMADHYGSAELVAGALKNTSTNTSLQFLTKWVPEPGPVSRDFVRQAVQRALKRLNSEKIDLMQFHAWNFADPRWLDCLFYLAELKKEGLVSHLGLTNFDTAHLRIVVHSGIPVISNQVSYSLLDQRAAGAMTEFCQKHNIHILAFGTLAGGFLSGKWYQKAEPSGDNLATWSQMKYKRFIDASGGWQKFQKLLSALKHIGDRHQMSISNVATRYILDQPAVAAVIVGARPGQSEHIQDNKGIFKIQLDSKDKEAITGALAELTAIPGDNGDEYRRSPFLTASGDLSHHLASLPAPYPSHPGADGRRKALSGTVWEDIAGFSRAVRKGDTIYVSGTTATHGALDIGGTDPAAQTHFVIDKIEGAIQSLGGKLEDVVRTRIYIKDLSDWEAIARAHGDRFKDIQPANTMVRADLIGNNYLVEIEVEAKLKI
jgi:aryl-alcohol dehydrogenase-like predicted oxidoreductase/enamine deaminase RidA (YjgF/YER057c/UK114 family)